jgi:Protein of unknown function (DUF2384)
VLLHCPIRHIARRRRIERRIRVQEISIPEAVVYEDDEQDPNDRRVDDDPSPVGDILALLDESLNPKRAGIWLLARNRSLGGKRPIDLIASGELERVRRSAELVKLGAGV